MEPSIIMLDDRTDQATKQMLENVVRRKKKFDRFKSRHLLVMWISIMSAFFYFLYLYYAVMQPYSYSFAAMFSAYVSHSANFYFLVITVGLYGWMNLLREKRDKAEKEYHALRAEIVDKSKDLWKTADEWKHRYIVYEMMKKNYDINLYHENK